MRGRLAQSSASGVISPLTDLVFNGMASMFVFLIVYICIVRPHRPSMPLEIVTETLPDAVWYNPYQSVVAVTGGEAPYSFQITNGAMPTPLHFGQDTGLIRGTPQSQPGQEGNGGEYEFTVQVTDARESAATKDLKLHVCPVAIPFDPQKHPLRWATNVTRLPDAWVGEPYERTPGLLGGIEPYEVSLERAPPGIVFAQGRFSGTPTAAAVPAGAEFRDYAIRTTAVDQQSAFLPPSAKRTPGLSIEYALRVRTIPPLEAEKVLPAFTKSGHEYRGAVVARGGRGKLRWKLVAGQLPADLSLDEDTGIISGIVRDKSANVGRSVDFPFSIEVDDKDASTTPAVLSDCLIRLLPPMRFVAPD